MQHPAGGDDGDGVEDDDVNVITMLLLPSVNVSHYADSDASA